MVKEGYKQTEVGVIPEDWRVTELGEHGKSIIGLTYSPLDVAESGTLVLRSSNIQDDKLTYDNNVFVSGSVPERVITRVGDVLICVRNGSKRLIGKCAILTEESCGSAFGTFMSVYRSDIGFYVLHQFRSNIIKKQIDEAMGATINQITNKNLESFLIPLPPTLAEQEAIAGALSDADGLIESLEQLIHKKRHIKQGAMQTLLSPWQEEPKDNAPSTKDTPQPKKLKSGWVEKQIGDFTDCTAGGTPSTHNSEFWGGDIPWMNSGELNHKKVDSVQGRITTKGLQSSSTKIIPANCILIGLAGQGKTRGTVAYNIIPLCTNQSIAAIYPNDKFSWRFLYYNLDSRYEELRELSTGDGGRGGLNLTIIRNLKVWIPDKQKQTRIATILSDMDTEISTLETKLSKAKKIKQGMMQELLTGKTRLI